MATSPAKTCCGPGYASPADAMLAPREKLLYTIAIYVGTGIQKPDYLATVDADPDSPTYSQVISRCEMPGIGDELHHMGWNACSSCFDDGEMERKYLIVPGVRSSNLHIVDCATDPRNPSVHKVISGEEIKAKTNLSAPHTVHCLGSDIIISMLGDAKGNAPGGFLHINKDFDIVGRWENDLGGHFWDFEKKKVENTVYLGEDGLVPLEVRFHHDPDSTHGFVGAAMSSNIIHWYKKDQEWIVNKIIDVENEKHPDWPIPLPGLITVILISMDDRFLYFCNWLHGDIRQYDISDPHNPVMTGQVWMGGMLKKAPVVNGVEIAGGPQMIQLSLDGKRLYVTTSLFSTWDNQFYPDIRHKGGVMLMVDCDMDKGGMEINKDFIVNFGNEPNGPSRCHETRYPGGDCTSDIWL